MQIEIDDEQRAEIYQALRERKEGLSQLEKATIKKNIPTQHIKERQALYITLPTRPSLTGIFASQEDLDDEVAAEREARGEKRDPEGQQDMFGGGSETGGGIPAGGKDTWRPEGATGPQRMGGPGVEHYDDDPRAETDYRPEGGSMLALVSGPEVGEAVIDTGGPEDVEAELLDDDLETVDEPTVEPE